MKLRSRYGWDLAPFRIKGKSAARLCMFSDVKPDKTSPGYSSVYLNVYDLTPVNAYVYWSGFGIFHTGVQGNGNGNVLTVHNVEYSFGAHDYPTSGVFEVEPRQCPEFKYRKSIYMGMTSLDPLETKEFMENQSRYYTGESYHLVVKNCNHFCDDICFKLTGRRIPKWVNRLARIGCVCKCILPDSLKATKVRDNLEDVQMCNEKRKLRSSLSCMREYGEGDDEEEVSISSSTLNSYYKGCLTSWEQTRTKPELEE